MAIEFTMCEDGSLTYDTNASGSQAAGLDTAITGGGGAHSIVQPYFVVYMWKRVS